MATKHRPIGIIRLSEIIIHVTFRPKIIPNSTVTILGSAPRTPEILIMHYGVITWKYLPHYKPFVRGIHRFPRQMASNVETVSMLWRHHARSILLASDNKISHFIDEKSRVYPYYEPLYINQWISTTVLLSPACGAWEVSPVKLQPLMWLIETFKW